MEGIGHIVSLGVGHIVSDRVGQCMSEPGSTHKNNLPGSQNKSLTDGGGEFRFETWRKPYL